MSVVTVHPTIVAEHFRDRIDQADIILAVDRSVGLEFVIYGKRVHNSFTSELHSPTIERFFANEPGDLQRICDFVEQSKGFHEFESFLDE